MTMNNEWWRGAVIYQIYPRSFMDANNDGTGDLRGIIQRFDHLASLGIDALWVSPFFKSPMKDFGYDVSDYRAVDPLFGDMDDFDELIALAHSHDIKIIIDQVLSHTALEHEWFLESRTSRDNAKADWYVWRDAKADGTPPTNWLSVFGGPAWTWEPRRGQYYLHNFLSSQPDLNFYNPEVRQASLDNMEFWLKKGVDGFRLDAVNFCVHDKEFRNNPAKDRGASKFMGEGMQSPYSMQTHKYAHTQPENLKFLEEIRELLNRYPGSVALGEIGTENSIEVMAEYTNGGKRLHMAYSFDLLTDDHSVAHIRHVVESLEDKMDDGWPCYALSNHDVKRVASRWVKSGADSQTHAIAAKAFNLLLGTLRGSVCNYQGEELGLTEADIAYEDLQDPYGMNFWPIFKGRDGCRTPMPWRHDSNYAGFSAVKPWLPVPSEHQERSVNQQSSTADSVLNAYRSFLAWRKQYPVLIHGDIEFIDTPEPILAFRRYADEHELQIFINLSGEMQTLEVALPSDAKVLSAYGASEAKLKGNGISFTAHSVCIVQTK